METEVAQPIEEAVNTVEGISELRSISGQGSSFVIATFDLDRDIDVAAQDVRDRVADGAARPAARHRSARRHEVRQRLAAGHDDRALGRPLACAS